MDRLRELQPRVGTVRSARPHPASRAPAIVLEIDFGPLGLRTSSARLAGDYAPEELVGRQVVALVGLPPKRVAGIDSQVLVLAAVSEDGRTRLLAPDARVPDGTPIA